MQVKLSEIVNIKPNSSSARVKDFRPLYALLCGIECEYAVNVLKKNKDDSLFKYISSYFLTQDISAKTLFKECMPTDPEMAEFHSFLKFNEQDQDDYVKVLESIQWKNENGENIFSVGELSFTSKVTFVDLKIYQGKPYALEVKETENESEFVALGVKNCPEDLKYRSLTNLSSFLAIQDINFEQFKTVSALNLSDEEFFQLTTKLKETDDEQKSAIRAATEKNLLIIAGAGSGKTRSLVGRLTYLHLVKGIPLNKLLLLTFTRAATQEMGASGLQEIKEAYKTKGSLTGKNPYVIANTIDGFFKQLIERYYLDAGLTEKPSFLFDSGYSRERLRMLNEVISNNHLNNVFSDYIKTEKDLRRLYSALDNCANGMTVNVSGIETLLDLFVEKQIQENKIVDFVYDGYILKKALENKDCPLYDRVVESYDCILIDEFQDINKLQNDVLSNFYNSKIHFTFVGDDDQTIYTWRGADNSIIKSMVGDASVNTVYLTTNYRNNPYIVNAGNDILESLDNRAKSGRIITAAKKNGTKVRITRYDEKYANLAHEIKKVYDARMPGEKICVLCRLVNDQDKFVDGHLQKIEGEGTKIARMLSLENVPTVYNNDDSMDFSDGYKLLKSLVFILNKIDVRNNCAYIKDILKSTASNTNIRKMVNGKLSYRQIDSNLSSSFTVEIIAKLAESLNTKFSYAGTVAELVSNYNRMFAELVEGQHGSEKITKDSSLLAFQQLASDYNWEYPRPKDKLREVFDLFEEDVSKKTSKKNPNNENCKDSVIISSIHKAKGLQYDTVFIVGLNDGEYPNDSRITAEYNRRVGEFERLKSSQENLGKLRTSVTEDTIKKLKKECSSTSWETCGNSELLEDMEAFSDEIDVYSDDYVKLSDDGVEAFLTAYEAYIDRYIQAYKDKIYSKAKEIAVVQEKADVKEESYHEAEDDSIESNTLFEEWQNLEKEVQIKQESLEAYKKKLDEFQKKIPEMLAFNEICNEAKGFLADVRKYRDYQTMIKKLTQEKEDKEREEKRLFYVAVSRASEKLYLCIRDGSFPSAFVKLIKPENCEKYIMRTQAQEDDIRKLEENIHNVRTEIAQVKVNEKKVNKGIEKILNYSDAFKEEMKAYITEYLTKHPEYSNLPTNAAPYFENAIGLLALSDKLGYNFKTEIVHNLQRFMQLYMQDKIGAKAKPYKTDSVSAKKITNDIRKIAKAKCKAGIPGEGFLMDLLTYESKYNDELERCKSLAVQCYVVCSGKYRVSEMISDSWKFKKFQYSNPEGFIVAALDLTNIRNVMIHDGNEVWTTDYLPYAFDCLDLVMKYFGQDKEIKPHTDDDEEEIDEVLLTAKLQAVLSNNKNILSDIKRTHSLINDSFDSKTAKLLCIVDEKVLKDIMSGVVNSKRGTIVSYLRTKSGKSNDTCLSILSIWEDSIAGVK